MIIDFHSHLFSEWNGVKGMSSEAMIRAMDKHGICQTVVFTLDGFWGDFRKANDELAKLTAPYRNRLIPFCTVHPYEVDRAVLEMQRCKTHFGMKGVKFHPWLQGFSVTSEAMIRVAESAERSGMIFVFHDGTPPYCEPLQIANLACRFPNLRIVLGHGGLKDYHDEALIAAKRFKNIYVGTNCPVSALERLCRELKGERILFGSDAGFGGYILEHSLNVMKALSIPEKMRKKILFENAQNLLETGD